MTPYDSIEVGHHRLRQWLVAWRHQAITYTNVDLVISEVQWKSPGGYLKHIYRNQLEKCWFQILFRSPKGQWVTASGCNDAFNAFWSTNTTWLHSLAFSFVPTASNAAIITGVERITENKRRQRQAKQLDSVTHAPSRGLSCTPRINTLLLYKW